jgi:protoheme IX farnesyltransferase
MTDASITSVKASTNILKSFFELMKPRVMSLVIFTALVGIVIAPIKPNFVDAAISLFFVALGAGASGALICGMMLRSMELCQGLVLDPFP